MNTWNLASCYWPLIDRPHLYSILWYLHLKDPGWLVGEHTHTLVVLASPPSDTVCWLPVTLACAALSCRNRLRSWLLALSKGSKLGRHILFFLGHFFLMFEVWRRSSLGCILIEEESEKKECKVAKKEKLNLVSYINKKVRVYSLWKLLSC